VEPGLYEYQVEAEIIAEFIGKGAEGHAFEPIVACGKNALVLHYVQNNGICGDGEMLLMDFGAEVNHYAADCSRTIPVNGRFTRRQRALYDAVLRVFRMARDLMVPGILMADFHQAVGELWEEEHMALGLYSRKDVEAHTDSEPLWKNYFMHGTSHSMGLDVHDPFDRSVPFKEGMVLTCEPAIYIREEGVGIRLENDILITENGPVDLMKDIPIEAEEIEELMNRNS
jgi:Xaa-Pro aminopeptidase